VPNPSNIDTAAPVIARHGTDIDAPLETVWRLHTDVNGWPEWQTDITEAQADRAFVPGASFTWTSYGFTVTSTIYEVDEGARVLWGGTADGITGVHEWIFRETPTGVRVETNESFAGEPVEADADAMQNMLDGSLSSWLEHLKVAAESQS
jgi:uncharacterized protein YndB with AHSA1/START domain